VAEVESGLHTRQTGDGAWEDVAELAPSAKAWPSRRSLQQDAAPRAMVFPEAGSAPFAATRALLVGTGPLAVQAAEILKSTTPLSVIVGALEAQPAPDLTQRFPDLPVLGGLDDLEREILGQCIDSIHVALPQGGEQALELAERARRLGTSTRLYQAGDGAALVVTALNDHPATAGLGRLAKRALDVTLAAGALLLLAPLFGAIAAAIRLTSRGPAIFRQPRVGARRRQFDMLKFRTMVDNAEELRPAVEALNDARGISFKVFQDPRVTRVGRILRRSSLDELPQLLNIIRGEMSLVGPRPIPVWVADQLDQETYVRRFAVLPGLTGLWQVEGREQDFDRMAQQDLRYLDTWSLALDVRILLQTLPAVLRGEGAH
jgi:lipopolysaccharide/colanic/teichoic acid biosynthesis glycosyltransferase